MRAEPAFMRSIGVHLALVALLASCNGAPPPPTAAPLGSAAGGARIDAPGAAPTPSPRIVDAAVVASATGGTPQTEDGVVKVSFPRADVPVQVDGWTMPPFMGLTSWAAFTPGEKPGVEAMVMGDLVLFEDEVSAAMSAALDAGLEVTALHNHFFFDQPRVYFMHVGGEGGLEALGKGVRAALDAARRVRTRSPTPARSFGGTPLPARSRIDPARVEAALGRKPTAKDGMAKVVVGRAAVVAECGCKVGKAMGVNTWASFAGTDDDAVVDGDFAVTEDELQPVLKTLRAGGMHVVAIHHHMTGEEPRILFLHYWGRGSVAQLGRVLKDALARTRAEPG